MQRGEHEVAGLGQAQRDLDRLEVAHLAEEDDVGVLTKGARRPWLERDVGADLALVDHRHLVMVEVLDRVLDGEDVHRLGLVDAVDHRRQGGRLAGTRRPHHEHDPVRLVEQRRARRGAAELLQRTYAERHDAQGERQRVALIEGVGAETAEAGDAEREVDLQVVPSSSTWRSSSSDITIRSVSA